MLSLFHTCCRTPRRAGWLATGLLWMALLAVPPSLQAAPPVRSDPAVATAAASSAATRHAVPPGQEAYVLGLLEPTGFERPTQDGLVVDSVSVERDRVHVGVFAVGHSPNAPPLAVVTLLPVPDAQAGDLMGAHLAVRLVVTNAPPNASALARTLADGILQRATRPLFVALPDRTPPPPAETAPHQPPQKQARPWLGALLGLLLLAPLLLLKTQAGPMGPPVKTTHWLPATLQTILFTYWGLWWPGLTAWLPFLAAQLAFAYALDAVMQWRKWRAVRFGFGPLPIVLSTNLFLQFPADQFHWQLLAIAIALLSRDLIQRDGRHVLNPSAFGVAVVGVLELTYVTGWTPADVALRFWLPPNMTEVVLMLALVVQLRLRPVLCSVGGALGLLLFHRLSGYPVWTPAWGPITLALALLITDPATSPQTSPGRLLYGLFIGFLMGAMDVTFDTAGLNDYYGKLLPIPIANALVPWFDAAGRRMGSGLQLLLSPRWNLAHIALWWLLALGDLTELKQQAFAAETHAYEHTRGIVQSGQAPPICKDNPMFCKPFQFGAELAFWTK